MTKLNNKDLGHLIGGCVGFILGIYSAIILNGDIMLPILNNSVKLHQVVTNILRVLLPFILGGWLSNWLANFGSFLDILTKKRTLIHLGKLFTKHLTNSHHVVETSRR